MKKNLLIIASILFINSISMFAQGEKIGYVDSQVILTQYPAAIKAQGDLDALTNLWSAQFRFSRIYGSVPPTSGPAFQNSA